MVRQVIFFSVLLHFIGWTHSVNADEAPAFSVLENYIAKHFRDTTATSFDGVLTRAQTLRKSGKHVDADTLVLSHYSAILAAHDHPDRALLLRELMLSFGAGLVNKTRIEWEAIDPESALILAIEQATYYADIEQFHTALSLLANDAAIESLPVNWQHQAWLTKGKALQHLKKHRDAIAYYNKITPESALFRLAKLNQATAFIRQEWWTDAQAAIQDALKINAKSKRDELDFRLYTFLGYSQLHFGFYRDARESFRHVAVSSQYLPKALMGLGLAALHQEDFIGAFNAFQQFSSRGIDDLSAMEAQLLAAFSLHQLKSYDKASAAYENAARLFEDQLKQLNDSRHLSRKEHQRDLILQKIDHALSLTDALEQQQPSTELVIASQQLKDARAKRYQHLLETEKFALESYLSQARFGIASLLDTVE